MTAADAHVIIENRSLEEKFDPEMRFRPLPTATAWLVAGLLLALSFFHYYTAGFGLLREATHRGIHMAFVELRSRLQVLVQQYGLLETLDRDHFYPSVKKALKAIREEEAEEAARPIDQR